MTDFDPIITITDVRQAGVCVPGARKWAEDHGIDFREFVKSGLRASVLRSHGEDAFLDRMVEAKRKEGLTNG